jgi:predicted neuraminidase
VLSPSPDEIAARMDGRLRPVGDGRWEALLPSPSVQNHAAFLAQGTDGLACLWFGGSLEGRPDISIHRAMLDGERWTAPDRLAGDDGLSEQNPVQFDAPDGRRLILHTAQPGGNQDACVVRMRLVPAFMESRYTVSSSERPIHAEKSESARLAVLCDRTLAGSAPRDLPLPAGTFIRAPIHVRDDGAWLLPVFRCVPRPGQRWTGAHDTAAVAISSDAGETWREVEVPGSIGSVHMTLVALGDGRLAAFYRRRQADFVHRSESRDGGESWTAPEPTDVPNNNASIAVIRLRDGRLAMACNPVNAAMHPDRRASLYDELGEDARPSATGGCNPVWGVPRAPMAICLSRDGGRTFPRRIVVEDGPGTCLTNDSLDGRNKELSYPSLVEAADGGLDLAYSYFRRAIKHVRLSAAWLEVR